MTPVTWIAAAVGVAATVDDLRRRQIANWIPAVALAGGLACHIWSDGWRGAALSLGGMAVGFAIFLIFYVLGGMGGGDIKLMAGFGALLGTTRTLEAALWTAIIGGLIATGAIGWAALRKAVARGSDQAQSGDVKFIPYAPAIALGAWLALVPKS
jgi:prepilin peptidase CpaA